MVWVVKYLRSNRDKALAILPPRLHDYLNSRILPSSWYPAADYRDLLRATGTIAGLGANMYSQLGTFLAQTDLNGIYKSHLRAGEPHRTLASLPAVWRNYWDAGDLSAQVENDKTALVVLKGYPEPFRELCQLVAGFVTEAVTLSGGRDAKITHSQCAVDRAADCRWRLTWS
jgi:hypothetical protein